MDRPPPVAMKKNPITGEMEKFESPALRTTSRTKSGDRGHGGLGLDDDDDEDEDEAPAKAAPPPLNRVRSAPNPRQPIRADAPLCARRVGGVSPATAAQARAARARPRQEDLPDPLSISRLLAVDTNAIPDFDVSRSGAGPEVGLPAPALAPAICRVV